MSRFFGGYGGGGGSSRGAGGGDGKSKNAGLSLAAHKTKGLSKKEASPEDRYQQLIAEKMNAHKQSVMKQKKYSHNLKNADANTQISKGAMQAMEIMAAKMAKRELKKKKGAEPVELKPMTLFGTYGGRIDGNGNVWNTQNKKVLTIDKKTGIMKTTGLFAKKIGKFDPKSHSTFLKIEKQMEAFAMKNGGAGGSIWGTTGGGGGGTIHDSNKGWW